MPMRTQDCLKVLADRRTDEVVVAAMTSGVLWPNLSNHPRDLLYLPSTMGGAPAVGLGLAMARPDLRVIVLNGDGCMLMNLGCLVTIGEQAPANLTLVVFDNGVYAITGEQATPGAGEVDFAAMAGAAGWPRTHAFSELEDWSKTAPDVLTGPGPVFVQLTVEPEPCPVWIPALPMPKRLERFQAALA
jgi:thiamine pyrophosphate-dependent acetolactate synthase large subunit-like protein